MLTSPYHPRFACAFVLVGVVFGCGRGGFNPPGLEDSAQSSLEPPNAGSGASFVPPSPNLDPPSASFDGLTNDQVVFDPILTLSGSYVSPAGELASLTVTVGGEQLSCTFDVGRWQCEGFGFPTEGPFAIDLNLSDAGGGVGSASVRVIHTIDRGGDTLLGSVPITHLASLTTTSALGLGWADLGSSGGGAPDGVPDLIIVSPQSRLQGFYVTNTNFDDSAFEQSGLFLPLNYPCHGVSTSPSRVDGGVEALGLASTSADESLLRWDGAAYVNLAEDASVVGDNLLLAGQGTQAVAFQFALFDFDLDGDSDIYRIGGGASIPNTNELLTNVGTTAFWEFQSRGSPDENASAGGTESRGLVVADFDLDGRSDLFVASRASGLHLNVTEAANTPRFLYRSSTTSSDFDFAPTGELLHGVSAFDYDNDGDMDLLLLPWPNGTARLYRNSSSQGPIAFTQVSFPALELNDIFQKTTAVPGDYDNDGDQDLFVTSDATTASPSPNVLLENRYISTVPESGFTRIADSTFSLPEGSSYTASWVDHDRDGDLDLFIGLHAGSADLTPGVYLARNQYYELGGRFFYYRAHVRINGRENPVGTRVVVRYGPHRQTQEYMPVIGFGSAPFPELHFGTGPYDRVDVEIYAPGDPADAPSLVKRDVSTSNTPGFVDVVDL
ncbi:MAG: CRTAC1 family protein [Myxococcota bacterium]